MKPCVIDINQLKWHVDGFHQHDYWLHHDWYDSGDTVSLNLNHVVTYERIEGFTFTEVEEEFFCTDWLGRKVTQAKQEKQIAGEIVYFNVSTIDGQSFSTTVDIEQAMINAGLKVGS